MIKRHPKQCWEVQKTFGLWGRVMASRVIEHMTETALVAVNQEVGS